MFPIYSLCGFILFISSYFAIHVSSLLKEDSKKPSKMHPDSKSQSMRSDKRKLTYNSLKHIFCIWKYNDLLRKINPNENIDRMRYHNCFLERNTLASTWGLLLAATRNYSWWAEGTIWDKTQVTYIQDPICCTIALAQRNNFFLWWI